MIQQQGESESDSQRYGRETLPQFNRRNTRVVAAQDLAEELSRDGEDVTAELMEMLLSGSARLLLVASVEVASKHDVEGLEKIGSLNWTPTDPWHHRLGYDC